MYLKAPRIHLSYSFIVPGNAAAVSSPAKTLEIIRKKCASYITYYETKKKKVIGYLCDFIKRILLATCHPDEETAGEPPPPSLLWFLTARMNAVQRKQNS